MKGNSRSPKKSLAALLLVSMFALTACSNPPADDTTGGTSSGQGTGGTGGGTTTTTPSPYKGFGVQLFASSDEGRANDIKNTFAKEGYNMIVVPLVVDSKTLYKTQVGPFATEMEANAMLAKMKTRYTKNAYVNSAVIKENP